MSSSVAFAGNMVFIRYAVKETLTPSWLYLLYLCILSPPFSVSTLDYKSTRWLHHLWRKVTRKRLQALCVPCQVVQTSGLTCMSSVETGEWRGKNAKIEEIKPGWSKRLFTAYLMKLIFCNRQLRKTCPNSLIARELDQIASSMKWVCSSYTFLYSYSCFLVIFKCHDHGRSPSTASSKKHKPWYDEAAPSCNSNAYIAEVK